MDGQRSFNSSERSNLVKNAVLEMFLLGETDDMIVTSFSTYRYTAAGRVSKIPITVIDMAGGSAYHGPGKTYFHLLTIYFNIFIQCV